MSDTPWMVLIITSEILNYTSKLSLLTVIEKVEKGEEKLMPLRNTSTV